jgi:hypothetical protein
MPHVVDPARENEVLMLSASAANPGAETLARIRHDFELHWLARLLLYHRRAISNCGSTKEISDLHLDEVAATKLAVDRQIKERPVS